MKATRNRRRLKVGKQQYCVIALRKGEEAAEIAKKLRELADQVSAAEASARLTR